MQCVQMWWYDVKSRCGSVRRCGLLWCEICCDVACMCGVELWMWNGARCGLCPCDVEYVLRDVVV